MEEIASACAGVFRVTRPGSRRNCALGRLLCYVVALAALNLTSHELRAGGFLDGLSTHAEGWAVDAANENGTCVVEFYADGPAGTGQPLGQCETKLLRSDVNSTLGITGNHGFSFAIPLEMWDATNHLIYAYAKSTATNRLYLLNRSPATFRQAALSMVFTNVGQLWMSPPWQTNEFPKLFYETNNWQGARAKLSVLKIADHLLLKNKDTLDLSNMVARLKEWDVALAFETGAVKWWGCTASVTFGVTKQAIDLIRSKGGEVRLVAMDEPLTQSAACGYTDGDTLRETVSYVSLLKTAFPGLVVGDIEPWPYFRKERLVSWIDSFRQISGAHFDFLHLDVDLARVRSISQDMALLSELPEISSACSARGIPFGVIFWQANVQLPVGSNRAFYENTLYWARLAHSVCKIDHAIVQTWETYPDSTVPDSELYTFTSLVKDYAQNLAYIPFPSPKVGMHRAGELSISGRPHGRYRIEFIETLGVTNAWGLRELVQLPAANWLWTDVTNSAFSRFYRVLGDH